MAIGLIKARFAPNTEVLEILEYIVRIPLNLPREAKETFKFKRVKRSSIKIRVSEKLNFTAV